MPAMRSRGSLLVGLTATVVLASAGASQGAVTIGNNLTNDGTVNMPGCNIPCTATNLTLPASSLAPGGLTSPVNGSVTSWRLRANQGPNVRLRILRRGAGNTFTGVGTSGPAGFAGPEGASDPIATSLPIQTGDSIGLESPDGNFIYGENIEGGAAFWNMPVLADGSAPRAPNGTSPVVEVLVQATIEPTNTFTSGAPVLNKKKGTATLTVDLPNPGTLDFSGTGISIAETAAVKTVAAPGPVKFLVSATGKKLKKLKRKGKAGVTATFTFTPTGGAASTQAVPVQLKKKLKKKKKK
jgi:hypothetical protein